MNVIFLTVLFLGELGLKIAVAKFGFVENLVARGLLYVYVGSMTLLTDEDKWDFDIAFYLFWAYLGYAGLCALCSIYMNI